MISKSITKKDHAEKMSGMAKYLADYRYKDMLHAKIVRSQKAHARILNIELPVMKEGYGIVDAFDVPINKIKVIKAEQPVFAEGEVKFIGEAILMIVGPDKELVEQYAADVTITYEELPAVLKLEDSVISCVRYEFEHGAVKELFDKAYRIREEIFTTGYQEQAYIEPQGAIGLYENEKITMIGSLQCPYYVKSAIEYAMEEAPDKVQVIQSTTGGAFGGKEDYPSLLGCFVAAAAKKFKKPVRLLYDRREDMAVTTKRHPARFVYRTALDENNEILAMDIDARLDGGAYEGLSSVVLQRCLLALTGVYKIPAIHVIGQVMETNTVPNGAFRGFGAPQSFFAIEMLMTHLAKEAGVLVLDYKKKYMVKQGDDTLTKGNFRYPVILPEMIAEAEKLSHYSEKAAQYQHQQGRYKKGIGMSVFLHGCGFTGSAEKDHIKSVLKLVKYEDDTVEILASNTDMGQGLKTTFAKIAAQVLSIPVENIRIANPDTDRVPNSGPTVASRSIMVVGKLIERAAEKLRDNYKKGEYQEIIEHYVHSEMIPWDISTFSGDAYPTYSWGVNVVETEVDTLLGQAKLLGVWGIFDVGTAIDETIMKGQMEGGMLQGLGYGSCEKMENAGGAIKQASMTDYIIPTAKDTIPFVTKMMENPYEGGPFGAKGAGELTIIGAAPAYAAAVECAIGKEVTAIPVTQEKILSLL